MSTSTSRRHPRVGRVRHAAPDGRQRRSARGGAGDADRDELEPGVTIGAPRPLALLPPFSSSDLSIPVTVAASVPNGTSVTITLHVAGDDTCDRAGITVMQTLNVGAAGVARTGIDGVAASPGADAATLRSAPATSLRAFDAGVCILQDKQ